MRVIRVRKMVVNLSAGLAVAGFLASSTAPVTASQTTSTPVPIGAASADDAALDVLYAGVTGSIEGYVAGGIAGAMIGNLPGAGTGMFVGAVSGFVASVVMTLIAGDYELTGLPKKTRLPKTVLD